jgi:hypothetical protein
MSSLDHIIVLLPHSLLHDLPTSLSDAFTITPGGKHNTATENQLIVFADGAYIELISFIPGADEEEAKKKHWWGRKANGTIDYALTSPSVPSSFPPSHDSPKEGGRIRPDGTKVEWVVTFPKPDFERGSVPFFCHDKTPRDLRVPLDEAKTTHPSGAVGAAGLTVRVPREAWEEVLKAYEGVFGSPSSTSDGGDEAVYEAPAVVGRERATIKLVKGEGEKVEFDEIVVRVKEGSKPQDIEEHFGGEGRPFVVRFE